MPPAARSSKRAPGGAKNSVAAARGGRAPRQSGGARRSTTGGAVWDVVRPLLGMIAIFLVVRTFFVEAFRIPSGSMIPTLLIGDWLFVNNLRYGPHIPILDKRLPGYAEPKRGDVVVFESPYQADEAAIGNDPTPTLVKRLVGTPGDTLAMRQGVLHVNGIAQRQGYAAATNPVGDPNTVSVLFDWQKPLGLRRSRFGAAPAQPTLDNWGPLVVPARRYFMLGDNRYESKDGRFWGLVPRENIRGRPLFVYYSFDTEAGLPFFRAFTEVRWGRIGHRIR